MAEARRESPLARLLAAAGGAPAPAAPGVTVRERPFLGHLDLRGDAGDARLAAAAADVLGIALPRRPNTACEGRSCTACWLGPDEWLLVTPAEREAGLARALREALSGLHFALTEVGGGQTVLVLGGPSVRDVLAMECPLDLESPALAPGTCAQTRLAKAAVLLRPLEGGEIELIVRRSYAEYLWTWLADATAECGLRVLPPDGAAP